MRRLAILAAGALVACGMLVAANAASTSGSGATQREDFTYAARASSGP